MGNTKYIKKVILPKNEECVFVDKTWRESPAFKITKANIINWNSKMTNTLSEDDIGIKVPPLNVSGQIPSEYIPTTIIGSASPATLLLVYLTTRNDEDIKLKGTEYNSTTDGYDYIIETKEENVTGEIGNFPVKKVILQSEMFEMPLNANYEIYFVADEGFQGIFKKEGSLIQRISYEFSNREQYDFIFQTGHLYRIKNNIVKDCSNIDATFENGIHQKSFDLQV